MDAFDFLSEGNFLKLIHINSIGMVNRMPFTPLYDFASVFQSVAHAWLFCLLEAIEIWDAFVTGIRSSYKGKEAYAVSEGLMQYLFPILSGVLQGFPLSGTLFVFVMDPLLWSFRRYLTGTVTRSCADDIGMASRRLEVQALVFKLFEDSRLVALLTLKPAPLFVPQPSGMWT